MRQKTKHKPQPFNIFKENQELEDVEIKGSKLLTHKQVFICLFFKLKM